MIVFKLTDQNGQTKNGTQWAPNTTHTVAGPLEMCGNGIHAYSDPLIAVLLNPIHANIEAPRLWECEASEERIDDHGLKSCHRDLTTIREIPLPEITTVQRVAFGILCALEAYSVHAFVMWARNWLNGTDRSCAASYASYAASYAAYPAYDAASAASAAIYAASAAAIDLPAIAKKAMSY